jgi:hypothetical protein
VRRLGCYRRSIRFGRWVQSSGSHLPWVGGDTSPYKRSYIRGTPEEMTQSSLRSSGVESSLGRIVARLWKGPKWYRSDGAFGRT